LPRRTNSHCDPTQISLQSLCRDFAAVEFLLEGLSFVRLTRKRDGQSLITNDARSWIPRTHVPNTDKFP